MKSSASPRRILITGGAGFLGVNAAVHLIERGWHATILDNLSRGGTERNLKWLITQHPARTTFIKEDVRDASVLTEHVKHQDAILHLAAQVAVTTSLLDPETDFEINARGTLNLLEAARKHNPEAPFVFASTNKVYGKLDHNSGPCKETTPLDFHSPYGCSKGTAATPMTPPNWIINCGKAAIVLLRSPSGRCTTSRRRLVYANAGKSLPAGTATPRPDL